jgi:hypothetical protein
MPARSYVGGHFQLVLDGVKTGFLKSLDGGAIVGEVVTEAVGASPFSKKHLGGISYTPFVAQFGMSMSGPLYEWINASWAGKAISKDGAIVLADLNLNAVSQREFSGALITEMSIPAMDAASKDAAYFTVKFAPEYTRTAKAFGKLPGVLKTDQKVWLASNFRLAIDGLDCTRVSRVGSLTVRQPLATDDIGDARDFSRVPGRIEFPNLTVTMSEASAQSWFDWFDDFVVKGNNDESREKSGSLSLLSANLADELMRIDFSNLGIFSIAHDKAEANSDTIAMVTAQLYCERMELRMGGAKPAMVREARIKKVKGRRRATSSRRRSRR